MIKTIKIAFLLFLSSNIGLCASKQPSYEVRGVVSDKTSGAMLEEAHVYLEKNGEVILETISKKDGSFTLKVSADPLSMENIQLRVKKRGYKTEMVFTLPGSDQVQVQLEPSKSIPIMIPKKSPTGQYIIVYNKTKETRNLISHYSFERSYSTSQRTSISRI